MLHWERLAIESQSLSPSATRSSPHTTGEGDWRQFSFLSLPCTHWSLGLGIFCVSITNSGATAQHSQQAHRTHTHNYKLLYFFSFISFCFSLFLRSTFFFLSNLFWTLLPFLFFFDLLVYFYKSRLCSTFSSFFHFFFFWKKVFLFFCVSTINWMFLIQLRRVIIVVAKWGERDMENSPIIQCLYRCYPIISPCTE